MSVVTYIPTSVELDGRPVEAPAQVTLYHPDGPTPSGSLTSTDPPRAGQSGRLVFEGRRDGKVWSVMCANITVTNRSALGCEFSIDSTPERTAIGHLEQDQPAGSRDKGFEEQFDIR
ncbi:MAG: hypothetical protein GY778_03245 [bacterium]|nr:hypothetical protein [bacterium]